MPSGYYGRDDRVRSVMIEARRGRFEELESAITDPALFDDPQLAKETLKEHRRLRETLELWESLRQREKQLRRRLPAALGTGGANGNGNSSDFDKF